MFLNFDILGDIYNIPLKDIFIHKYIEIKDGYIHAKEVNDTTIPYEIGVRYLTGTITGKVYTGSYTTHVSYGDDLRNHLFRYSINNKTIYIILKDTTYNLNATDGLIDNFSLFHINGSNNNIVINIVGNNVVNFGQPGDDKAFAIVSTNGNDNNVIINFTTTGKLIYNATSGASASSVYYLATPTITKFNICTVINRQNFIHNCKIIGIIGSEQSKRTWNNRNADDGNIIFYSGLGIMLDKLDNYINTDVPMNT